MALCQVEKVLFECIGRLWIAVWLLDKLGSGTSNVTAHTCSRWILWHDGWAWFAAEAFDLFIWCVYVLFVFFRHQTWPNLGQPNVLKDWLMWADDGVIICGFLQCNWAKLQAVSSTHTIAFTKCGYWNWKWQTRNIRLPKKKNKSSISSRFKRFLTTIKLNHRHCSVKLCSDYHKFSEINTHESARRPAQYVTRLGKCHPKHQP